MIKRKSLLARLEALEKRTPTALVLECQNQAGELIEVSVKEYGASDTLVFRRVISGASLKDLDEFLYLFDLRARA